MEFGRSSSPSSFIKMLSSTFLLLLLFTTFPSSIEAFECVQNGACIAGSEYNASTFFKKPDPKQNQIINCDDGCAAFSCVVDKKKVMTGGGCYSDFVKVCKDAPAEAKFNVKQLSDEPRVIRAPNLFVVGCNGENCTAEANFMVAVEVAKNVDFFSNQFIVGMDKKFSDKCEYPVIKREQLTTTTKTDSGISGLMNQIDGFKFFGMILSGLILAQFR